MKNNTIINNDKEEVKEDEDDEKNKDNVDEDEEDDNKDGVSQICNRFWHQWCSLQCSQNEQKHARRLQEIHIIDEFQM